MKYLSLFSGIEAATSAWRPLGWECVGVAEKSQETGSIVAANKQVKFRCADCEAKRNVAMKGK